jgi:hypothetical protein
MCIAQHAYYALCQEPILRLSLVLKVFSVSFGPEPLLTRDAGCEVRLTAMPALIFKY